VGYLPAGSVRIQQRLCLCGVQSVAPLQPEKARHNRKRVGAAGGALRRVARQKHASRDRQPTGALPTPQPAPVQCAAAARGAPLPSMARAPPNVSRRLPTSSPALSSALYSPGDARFAIRSLCRLQPSMARAMALTGPGPLRCAVGGAQAALLWRARPQAQDLGGALPRVAAAARRAARHEPRAFALVRARDGVRGHAGARGARLQYTSGRASSPRASYAPAGQCDAAGTPGLRLDRAARRTPHATRRTPHAARRTPHAVIPSGPASGAPTPPDPQN